MTIPIILTAAVLAVFLSYALFSPVALNLGRFLGRSRVYCPTHTTFGNIRVNALGASLTAGYGEPTLHVRDCTLLHPGEQCGEDCLKSAEF
jgi:hypothetical protein